MLALQDIRYFRTAATSMSFRQAARALLVTQSALTQAMKRLEDHLGHALFERRSTGVRLTAAGARLLERAEPLVAQWDALGSDLSAADARLHGRVVIGCHSAVAQFTLPLVLPRLLASHPDLELKLVHDLSRAVTDAVNAGPVDLGIVVNPFGFPDLVISPLITDDVAFWAPRKVTPGVLFCDPSLVQTQWLLRNIAKKRPFKRVIESSSLEVIRDLAASGAGTAILPTRVAAQSRARLQRVNHLSAPYRDRICLVHRPAFAKTILGRTVIDAFKTIGSKTSEAR